MTPDKNMEGLVDLALGERSDGWTGDACCISCATAEALCEAIQSLQRERDEAGKLLVCMQGLVRIKYGNQYEDVNEEMAAVDAWLARLQEEGK